MSRRDERDVLQVAIHESLGHVLDVLHVATDPMFLWAGRYIMPFENSPEISGWMVALKKSTLISAYGIDNTFLPSDENMTWLISILSFVLRLSAFLLAAGQPYKTDFLLKPNGEMKLSWSMARSSCTLHGFYHRYSNRQQNNLWKTIMG